MIWEGSYGSVSLNNVVLFSSNPVNNCKGIKKKKKKESPCQ